MITKIYRKFIEVIKIPFYRRLYIELIKTKNDELRRNIC